MKKKTILDQIKDADAAAILRELAASDAGIAAKAAATADRLLIEAVDVEGIAADVQSELDAIAIEDLWDQSGSHRDGYHDPGEEAADMCEAALQPFLDELSRYQDLGRATEAREYGKGILLGLHRFETESTTEFRDWAEDVPAELAHRVLDDVRQTVTDKAGRQELDAFVCANCPRFATRSA